MSDDTPPPPPMPFEAWQKQVESTLIDMGAQQTIWTMVILALLDTHPDKSRVLDVYEKFITTLENRALYSAQASDELNERLHFHHQKALQEIHGAIAGWKKK